MSGRGSSETITVTLAQPAPVGAIALVLVDDAGGAMAWGAPPGGRKAFDLVVRGRCGVLPDGTRLPKNNQKVRMFWVDDNGERSPVSNAIVATATFDGHGME